MKGERAGFLSMVDVFFWYTVYGLCRLHSTILEVWIVAFVSFEALHHNNTSTLDDALAAGDTKAPEVDSLLWHLGHNQHKALKNTLEMHLIKRYQEHIPDVPA